MLSALFQHILHAELVVVSGDERDHWLLSLTKHYTKKKV